MDLAAFCRGAARWTGLIGSLLTILLGLIHILSANATIVWPPHEGKKFNYDIQKTTWRDELFSLEPSILTDNWTPFVVGLIGFAGHCKEYVRFRFVTESFVNYFIWNMFQGLFATIAYEGAIGILFSIPVWISALFSLLSLMLDDGDASLELNFKCSLRPRRPETVP